MSTDTNDKDKKSNDTKLIEQKIAKHNIGEYTRHIFLCAGDKCCNEEKGEKTWEYLKEACEELRQQGIKVYRTKTTCLRICAAGPIALVYPEGTWYRDVDKNNCKRIVEQHLTKGKVVEELQFAKNPL
ncbi:MAG: hypothetical protein KBD78_11515 [Oligoflexales bacterium]|nr:hypothetical protein [Oligoflexales bacterium]